VTGLEQAFEQSIRGAQSDTGPTARGAEHDGASGDARNGGTDRPQPFFVTPKGILSLSGQESPRVGVETAAEPTSQIVAAQSEDLFIPGPGAFVMQADISPAEASFFSSFAAERLDAHGAIIPIVSAACVSTIAVAWFFSRHRSIAVAEPTRSNGLQPSEAAGGASSRLYPRACRFLP
jgi:hypothetical protein